MADITKHYLISGRVQGVGFRAFTARMAEGLNIKGWVRNLSDGRVECMARGSVESQSKLLAEFKKGPKFGLVTAISVEEWKSSSCDDEEGFLKFEVRKDSLSPCEK